ncbi:BnaUnng04480D [Brassica napus]|uniref:Uncharacterized protein n=2 Tax=Brassica TaxID=3705 RepID=A0A0D3C0Q9_BRAOL|nr:unnamed protein product [Brassica napus]CDY71636.1 BnaUnng04480D [Brassica napus]
MKKVTSAAAKMPVKDERVAAAMTVDQIDGCRASCTTEASGGRQLRIIRRPLFCCNGEYVNGGHGPQDSAVAVAVAVALLLR